jgi:hypothetical protein
MSNTCNRCGRGISTPGAAYGPECARILGKKICGTPKNSSQTPENKQFVGRLSPGDEKLSPEIQNEIKWNSANFQRYQAEGNQKGMDWAHKSANELRGKEDLSNLVSLNNTIFSIGGNVRYDKQSHQSYVSFPGFGEIPVETKSVNNAAMIDEKRLNNWLKSEFNIDMEKRQNTYESFRDFPTNADTHRLAGLFTNPTAPRTVEDTHLLNQFYYDFGFNRTNTPYWGFDGNVSRDGNRSRQIAANQAVNDLVFGPHGAGNGSLDERTAGAWLQLMSEMNTPEDKARIMGKLRTRFEDYIKGTPDWNAHDRQTRAAQLSEQQRTIVAQQANQPPQPPLAERQETNQYVPQIMRPQEQRQPEIRNAPQRTSNFSISDTVKNVARNIGDGLRIAAGAIMPFGTGLPLAAEVPLRRINEANARDNQQISDAMHKWNTEYVPQRADMSGTQPPNKAEAAEAIRHLYAWNRDPDNTSNEDLVGGWNFERRLPDTGGATMGQYERNCPQTGQRQVMLVNMGTQSGRDWGQNFLQPLGRSSDMRNSILAVLKFMKENPDADVSYAGHSKGAGESQGNAMATGANVITFNSAEINAMAYGLNRDNKGTHLPVVIPGDPLTAVNRALPFGNNPNNAYTLPRGSLFENPEFMRTHGAALTPILGAGVAPVATLESFIRAALTNHSMEEVNRMLRENYPHLYE